MGVGLPTALFLALCIGVEVLADTSINVYLDEKLRQSKVEIAKVHIQESPPVQVKSYNVQWDKLWSEPVGEERAFIANMFDRIFVLKSNRVMELSVGPTPSNGTSVLQEVAEIRCDDSIKFVRSIVWKSVLYLLVCTEAGPCSLYTATDNLQLRHRQTMQHRGSPMDASFFTRANRLYLVVADNSGRFTVPSVIYLWRGTYMDVVTDVLTVAAVSVTTFKHKESTIIVFMQNEATAPRIGSVVYEFRDTTAERIQFLPTIRPISIQHYDHGGFDFILLLNEIAPSNLFWWDGKELLNWQMLPEIRAPSLIQIINVDGSTFFFIGHESVLEVHQFHSGTESTRLGSVDLKNRGVVIDMRIQIDGSTIIMVLVLLDRTNVYSIETWELHIKEATHGSYTEGLESPSKCLTELIELLERRKPIVDKAQSSWPTLLPSSENLTISQPIVVPELILEAGTTENIHLVVTEEIVAPRKIREKLESLRREVDDVLAASKDVLTVNKENTLIGDIVIDGDASFEELHIDSVYVDYLNGVDVRTSEDFLRKYTLENSTLLRGRNITIEDLEVESLCGIPSKYWAMKNDTSKLLLNVKDNNVDFAEDSVILHSDASLPTLRVKTLNDMDVDKFLSELFILNHNQVIKGNVTYKNALRITDLTLQTLNGEPFQNLVTATTDQSIEDFSVKSLKVNNLYADSINGVLVSEAARISRENTIKGKVRVANLRVTERFTADDGLDLPKVETHQIYSDVTIHGNLRVKTVDLKGNGIVIVNGTTINLDDMFETYWTKSTNQTIKDKIAFENNVIIDRLDTKYLNGFSEDEYLYTTVKEISEIFENLHFEHFNTDESFYVEGTDANLFVNTPQSLTITKSLNFEDLRVNRLFADVFNGISVNEILTGKGSLTFKEPMNFTSIKATKTNADEFVLHYLNGRDISTLLEGKFNIEEYLKTYFTKSSKLDVEHFNVESINGVDIQKLFDAIKNIAKTNVKNLTIDGDLRVKNNLRVTQIGDQSAESYLKNLAEKDLVISSGREFENLVVQNLTLNMLHGRNVDSFFKSILSRTREQTIPGQFSIYKISTDDLTTNFINNQNTANLLWIDQPLVLTGNVTFNDLHVEGDVLTEALNGEKINELYENMLKTAVEEVGDLTVSGSVTWETPSSDATSVSYLVKNAITADADQIIYGSTTFQNDVTAATMRGRMKEAEEVREIIADTVIDDGRTIRVAGRKRFMRDLTIDDLSVSEDIGVLKVNSVDILAFNDSVVRKDREETISNRVTFRDEVTATEMFVSDTVHGVNVSALAVASDTLPNNTVFKHLVVLKDVYLKNLDGVDFDEFVRDRVTLNGVNDIFSDVQLNGDVEVTGNTIASRINGIPPAQLVLNDVDEPQFISGKKMFDEDLIVDGDVHAPIINNVDLLEKYNEGVQNDENVEIFGDLIFEDELEVTKNISVSQLVNGVDLHTVLDRLKDRSHDMIKILKENETAIDEKISRASRISETLGNILSHLEQEENLRIEVPNIKKVDVVYFENVTKLNMYGEDEGSLCGLPSTCSCPMEYVGELTQNECNVWKTDGNAIVRNFHETNGIFGINVITNTVSSSPECTSRNVANEFTTISRMTPGLMKTQDIVSIVENEPFKIRGYLKDAQVFMHNHDAYIVLAIYYDPIHATHQTQSQIYKYNFEMDAVSFHQDIPTHGASAIQVFKNDYYQGAHLLIGCFGDSSTPTESTHSLLYRLDVSTSKFVLLRTFAGKTRYVKSLRQETHQFVLLDDFETNAVNFFHYDPEKDNYYDYQSLFHDSRVNGVECFYADDFGRSDSFVIVTTEDGQFFIYEYMFAQKFQVKVHYWMDDLQTMVPFYYSKRRYIFTGTGKNSTVLRIVQQGPH